MASPRARVNSRLVTTVYDIMLAHYAVEREGLPGQWPTDYMDLTPGTPAWQEEVHVGSRRNRHQDRSRVRAERGRDAGPFP